MTVAGKNSSGAVVGQRLNESGQISASTAQTRGILSIVLMEASKLSKVTDFSREKGVAAWIARSALPEPGPGACSVRCIGAYELFGLCYRCRGIVSDLHVACRNALGSPQTSR